MLKRCSSGGSLGRAAAADEEGTRKLPQVAVCRWVEGAGQLLEGARRREAHRPVGTRVAWLLFAAVRAPLAVSAGPVAAVGAPLAVAARPLAAAVAAKRPALRRLRAFWRRGGVTALATPAGERQGGMRRSGREEVMRVWVQSRTQCRCSRCDAGKV